MAILEFLKKLLIGYHFRECQEGGNLDVEESEIYALADRKDLCFWEFTRSRRKCLLQKGYQQVER